MDKRNFIGRLLSFVAIPGFAKSMSQNVALADTTVAPQSSPSGSAGDEFGAPRVDRATGGKILAVPTIQVLRKGTGTREDALIAFVAGYWTVGDGGGGTYWYSQDAPRSGDNGGSLIAADDGGCWHLLTAGGMNVKQFGARGDGSSDDSAAFQAAADAVIELRKVASGQNVQITIPPGKYRIARSIRIPPEVAWVGYGASLIGPIIGAERIGQFTAIAEAGDSAKQCAGACFTDGGGRETLYTPTFEGIDFQGFRWGFVSQCFAWNEPQIINCNFTECDGVAFAYQGAQSWNFVDPIINNCFVGFAGAATAFVQGNPYVGRDNFFADNIKMSGRRQNWYISASSAFDAWFQKSILRPVEISRVVGFFGPYALRDQQTACSISGRGLYLPSRNGRIIFNATVRDVILFRSPRGCAFVSSPYLCEFQSISGEECFLDKTINALGTSEAMITLAPAVIPITGSLRNIDGYFSSRGALGLAAAVQILPGGVAGVLSADTLNGPIIGVQHFAANLGNNLSDPKEYFAFQSQVRGLEMRATGIGHIQNVGARSVTFAPGSNTRFKEDSFGSTQLSVFMSGKLPSDLRTETTASLVSDGAISHGGGLFPIQGSLQVWVRRMDTGGQDFWEGLITLNQRNSSTALGRAVPAGSHFLNVTSRTNGLGAGATIRIAGADGYVVEDVDGKNVKLTSATRSDYRAGDSITMVYGIDRVITPLVSGMAAVAADPSNSSIDISNLLGRGITLEWRALFTSHGPPI